MARNFSQSTINQMVECAEKYGTKVAAEKFNVSNSTIYYHKKKKRADEARKLSHVITPKEEIKDNPNITFQSEGMEYKRGDIYYIHKFDTVGKEMATGRPAIIVSNDRCNAKLDTVQVVFLTTKNRCIAPEHFTIQATGVTSTVICEQITAVDKRRIGNFIGSCTPDEISLLNKALLASLDLDEYVSRKLSDEQIIARITAIKAERDAYKRIYDELFEKMMKKNT